MEGEEIGRVVKFFAKPSAAAIELTGGSLGVGDTIHIKGHTTDFQQQIDSMEIDNVPVQKAEQGSLIGVKVRERVRPNDVIYKITP